MTSRHPRAPLPLCARRGHRPASLHDKREWGDAYIKRQQHVKDYFPIYAGKCGLLDLFCPNDASREDFDVVAEFILNCQDNAGMNVNPFDNSRSSPVINDGIVDV